MRKSLKKVAASVLAATLALTVVASMGSTADAAKKSKKAKKAAEKTAAAFDPAGSYKAFVGFQQTESWRFHDECTSETLGLTGTDLNGLNYETDVMWSGDNGTEKIDGTVEGVELKGNGTYTAKITDLNGVLANAPEGVSADQMKISMLYLSTNLPADAKDKVQFSDVSLKVDGNEVTLPETQFFKPETLDAGYTSLYLIDTYAKGQGEYVDSPELAMAPNDSIEITFTVSGFANDNPDAVAATPTPAPEQDDASSAESADEDDSEGGSSVNAGVIAGIVGAVVVVAGIVVVVTRKKK